MSPHSRLLVLLLLFCSALSAAADAAAPAPRAVTPRGLENLIAFTRLYGIVRHFHPSDEAAAADWNAIAVDGAERVEGAKNADELAARLGEVFLPLAPTLRVFASKTTPPAAAEKPASATAVVGWEHFGVGAKKPHTLYHSERIRRALDREDARIADPLQPLRVDLGGGVTALVPLAVFADATRTLPAPSREAAAAPAAAYTGNDRSTRIGAVAILWNLMQHFYPYFDVTDVDWAAELPKALRAAGTDRNENAFLLTLRRLVEALDDGHGTVRLTTNSAPLGTLPLFWRTIGDALIVQTVEPEAQGVSAGDEVVAIDGKPAMQAVREREALISGATPQWKRVVALRGLATGTGPAVLTIRNAGGTTRQVTLPRAPRPVPLTEPRPEKIAELKPGVWYFDLTRASDADFAGALEKLASARGIVFDLRGYPNVGITPLRHLIDGLTESAQWGIPVTRRPNRQDVEWVSRGRWRLMPLQPRLTKNVVFLTDGRAISYAESWMGIVEAAKLGTIVGETTAGTNGNINTVELPGNYRAVFTGMRVLKHDGSRHHGVGIAPNVPVSPTIAGVRAGRDEQLEKAIAILDSGSQRADKDL